MDFLSQFLPIIIYILLIVFIIIGIILGIRLIITIDKIEKVVDDVSSKVARVTPIFDMLGFVSDKMSGIVGTVVSTVESFAMKLFNRHKESEEDE